MVSANVLAPQALQSAPEAVAIRPSVRLPAWLEVAKHLQLAVMKVRLGIQCRHGCFAIV